jgi:hypothetical protein
MAHPRGSRGEAVRARDRTSLDGAVRLRRYHAGRELRVCSSELAELMRKPRVGGGGGNEKDVSPEEAAGQYLKRRRLGRAPKKSG